jgi:Txe/YoeB family toxin of Txe-Axe toxin-antitoxin module
MATVKRFEELHVWQCEILSRRIANLIEYLRNTPFQGHQLREPGLDYTVDPPDNQSERAAFASETFQPET